LEILDHGIFFDGEKTHSFTNGACLRENAHCQYGVNITNETKLSVRAWVSTHDAFAFGQEAWSDIPYGQKVFWNRTSNNTVTIEVNGTPFKHQTAGTPGSNLFVKADGIYFGDDKQYSYAFIKPAIVVSSPIHAKAPDTRNYRELIYKLCQKNTNVKVAIDWPDSATTDARDKQKFDESFRIWDVCTDPKTSDTARRKAFGEITNLVTNTTWFHKYTGLVYQSVREALRGSENIDIVCIEGGPISRVESAEMEAIRDRLEQETRKDGRNAHIEVKRYRNLDDFMRSL
jgi:hypothetical protein